MIITLRPPTEADRGAVDGVVIAVAEERSERSGILRTHPVVGVEQGDWVDEVHISRKNGDSKYGYILYLPSS